MKRISMAMVGLNFGRHVVDTMLTGAASKHVHLTTLCDRLPERLDPMVAKTGLHSCRDLEEILVDPAIEAIGVFTGPVGRAELIRKCIRAGKHVMTTKPFERDPEAARAVLLEAKKLGRVVHMNSPGAELSGDLRQIRAWQEEFKLGRVVACRRSVWASYRETPDGTWYDDSAQCPVAPIFRLGIYAINDLVQLLGPAEKVNVMQSRLFTGRRTADNSQLGILFKNGAIANIYASFCINDGQFYRNSLTLNCENGTIFRNVGPRSPGAVQYAANMSVVAGNLFRPEHPVAATAQFDDVSGDYQWGAFARAIHGEALREEVTIEQIVGGLQIIDAMARAEQSGATETVMDSAGTDGGGEKSVCGTVGVPRARTHEKT